MENVLTSAAQSESAAKRPSGIRCIETVIQRWQRHAQAWMDCGAARAVLGSPGRIRPIFVLCPKTFKHPWDLSEQLSPLGTCRRCIAPRGGTRTRQASAAHLALKRRLCWRALRLGRLPRCRPYASRGWRKEGSRAILFFSESSPEIFFISGGGSGLNALAAATLYSMCSTLGMPMTVAATGSDIA